MNDVSAAVAILTEIWTDGIPRADYEKALRVAAIASRGRRITETAESPPLAEPRRPGRRSDGGLTVKDWVTKILTEEGPKTAADLVAATGAAPPSIYGALQKLKTKRTDDGKFTLK